MWIKVPDLVKTILVQNDDFDLVYTINGGWLNNDYPDHIAFEYNGVFYIAEDVSRIFSPVGFANFGFKNRIPIYFPAEKPEDRRNGYFYKVGNDWVLSYSPERFWYSKYGQTIQGDLKLNRSTLKLEPYNIASGSDPISLTFGTVELIGCELYKCGTQLGEYVWQGNGVKDSIIFGFREYTHKALDEQGNQTNEDVTVTQSLQLTVDFSSDWSYSYQGKIYRYTGELPLSNFDMTADDSSVLTMNYVKLVSIERNVLNFDGGAQIVD